MTCTATYTVTQADIDAGTVTNTATATAKDTAGTSHTSPGSTAKLDRVDARAPAPCSLTKSAAARPPSAPPAKPITYSFLVTNTGNVTVTNMTITERQLHRHPALMSAVTCPASATTHGPQPPS